MELKDQFAQRRQAALQKRNAALERWLQQNPKFTHSDTHKLAFLNGYDSAEGQLPLTYEEFIASQSLRFQAEAAEKRERLADLPAGACPECEGVGQFVGATHITPCDACNGTGRVA